MKATGGAHFIACRGGGPDGARGEVAGREAGAEGDDGLRVAGVAAGGSWSTKIACLWIGTMARARSAGYRSRGPAAALLVRHVGLRPTAHMGG